LAILINAYRYMQGKVANLAFKFFKPDFEILAFFKHFWLFSEIKKGSDYGYACPEAIQIKGSVCNSNCVDLVA